MIPTTFGVLARPLANPLVLVVDTSITYTGSTANNQFQLRYQFSGYDCLVDWGDGSSDPIFGNFGTATTLTHTYASTGIYTVSIYGQFTAMVYANMSDCGKILEIANWGDTVWGNMVNAWNGCRNLELTATDVPNLSSVANFNNIFRDCYALTDVNDKLKDWDVSTVTNMESSFRNARVFNRNLGSWDVSNVTTFANMFNMNGTSSAFNNGGSSDINNWSIRTTGTVSMQTMFFDCTTFNQPIGNWNVGNVTTFAQMLQNATVFNQYLGAWNLRLVGTNLGSIFRSSGMSCANYTDTISAWAAYVQANGGTPASVTMTTQTGRIFANARTAPGFADAQAARLYLTGTAGWTISGDTVQTNC